MPQTQTGELAPTPSNSDHYESESSRVGVGVDFTKSTIQPSETAKQAFRAMGRNVDRDLSTVDTALSIGFLEQNVEASVPGSVETAHDVSTNVANRIARDIVEGKGAEFEPDPTILERLDTVLEAGREKLGEGKEFIRKDAERSFRLTPQDREFLDAARIKARGRVSQFVSFIKREAQDDRGEVSGRTLATGLGILGLVGASLLVAQAVSGWLNHTSTENDAHNKADQAQLAEDWIDYSANNRSEDEELVGTFTIDADNPTVNQGTINVLGTTDISHTANQSGIDLGPYSDGDEFAVVRENSDNSPDGSKEEVVERLSTYNSPPSSEPETPPSTK